MKFKRLIISLFIIFIFISNFVLTASYADDDNSNRSTEFDHYFSVPANTWTSGNKKVQVTTGVNAANLCLQNGRELVHISSDIDDNTTTVSVTEPIEIICLVDVSTSMAFDSKDNLGRRKCQICITSKGTDTVY